MDFQHRPTTDFRHALLMALGVVGLAAFAPFAVWHAYHREWVVLAIDLVMVVMITVSMWLLHRGVDDERIGFGAALVIALNTITLTMLDPGFGMQWSYPAILSHALLVNRSSHAAFLSLAMLFVMAMALPKEGSLGTTPFVASTLLVTMFAYIFASRSESQVRQLEQLALRDPLTGLDNRRAFDAAMEQALREAGSGQHPHGLALLDLDGFKAINDAFGHEAGDEVLRELSGLIRDYLRASDRLFRIGGEEFVLLLPGADADGMHARMDNLRARIESQLRCRGRAVTASIGVAGWQPGDTATSWLMRADAAMYRAKRKGRNCVVVHELHAVG